MRILPFAGSGSVYTSWAYLLLGNWNRLEDVNTLIDPGADPGVVGFIEAASTGVGKRRVERVILTHRHYDHVLMLGEVVRRWRPEVLAFGAAGEGVDRGLRDGEHVRAGDRELEVISVPGHTDDSICLYAPAERVLFVGDSPVVAVSADSTYERGFVEAVERLCLLRVDQIYFGHGAPLIEGCHERLARAAVLARRNLVPPVVW
jgi:glyoxylase-like metal-dependent hydrolase (beta-lactamase superfamily II)